VNEPNPYQSPIASTKAEPEPALPSKTFRWRLLAAIFLPFYGIAMICSGCAAIVATLGAINSTMRQSGYRSPTLAMLFALLSVILPIGGCFLSFAGLRFWRMKWWSAWICSALGFSLAVLAAMVAVAIANQFPDQVGN
jgi:hypothetical protein